MSVVLQFNDEGKLEKKKFKRAQRTEDGGLIYFFFSLRNTELEHSSPIVALPLYVPYTCPSSPQHTLTISVASAHY